MIHHYLKLFYDIYNIIDQHYQKQIRCLPLILLGLWYLCKRESKSFSMISAILLLVIISLLSLFVYIIRILSESLEEVKLVAILNKFSDLRSIIVSI